MTMPVTTDCGKAKQTPGKQNRADAVATLRESVKQELGVNDAADAAVPAMEFNALVSAGTRTSFAT